MLIPFISDFSNNRARPNDQSTTLIEAIGMLLPTALASILGLTDIVARLLAPLPKVIPFLTAAPVAAVIGGCAIVISRRKLTLIGQVYHYPERLRFCAKLVFAPLLAIAATSIWPYVPNGLARRVQMGGFICKADTGHAIGTGRVQILDSAKHPISSGSFPTDSIGFFYVDSISAWATIPAYVRFVGPDCRPDDIAIEDSVPAVYPGSCPSDAVRDRPEGNWPMWLVDCNKQGKEISK